MPPEPRPVSGAGVPWFTGLLVTGFTAVVVAVAVIAFGTQLARINPVLAVFLELVVVAGVAPTAWRYRRTQVWRWVVYGLGVGVLAGWVAALAGAT
ncbi:DUF2537 domain-containing protein [Rhodococcus sp. FXJ9.536]|uniref:DUF2537 domain-containing protein n=1 Tax=Rhodococcus tibetensis TaxID=2965064 RepID=A0ABT1Q6X4_9NOCA|nr:DUF2537 domain-containing protein [Rhodococcus sp. FXJ9.536]MCQ4117989.1 DUF2537 domain-containing protein [Rhodococcus sp. FXJ9.536]